MKTRHPPTDCSICYDVRGVGDHAASVRSVAFGLGGDIAGFRSAVANVGNGSIGVPWQRRRYFSKCTGRKR